MSSKKDDPPSAQKQSGQAAYKRLSREDARAAKLRENLQKRKQQLRARKADPPSTEQDDKDA